MKISRIAVAALVIYGFSVALAKDKKPVEVQFEEHRQATLELIRSEHQDCELASFIPRIESVNFEFVYVRYPRTDKTVLGWAYPERNLIVFNTFFHWNRKMAIRAILHEMYHFFEICGPDSNRSVTAICYVLSREIHESSDLTEAIKRHISNPVHSGIARNF